MDSFLEEDAPSYLASVCDNLVDLEGGVFGRVVVSLGIPFAARTCSQFLCWQVEDGIRGCQNSADDPVVYIETRSTGSNLWRYVPITSRYSSP